MTKKLIAIAISSIGLAAAGAYANEGHMQHKQQNSSEQSNTSPSAQSSGHETTQQSAQAQDSDTVKKVQTALTQQGYDPGPADGQLGSKTEAAIKQAQKDKSLEATGQINQQTLAALGVNESGSSGTSSSGSSATNGSSASNESSSSSSASARQHELAGYDAEHRESVGLGIERR